MKATLGVGISVLSALAAQGKNFDIYRFGCDEEMPLKKYLPRLRELLGGAEK